MSSYRLNNQQVPLDTMSRDAMQLIMQGLATMVRIAQGDDIKHAMAAGAWLVSYGERVLAERRSHKPVIPASRESIIDELRGLYAKALGEAPLIVEAEAQAESEPLRR